MTAATRQEIGRTARTEPNMTMLSSQKGSTGARSDLQSVAIGRSRPPIGLLPSPGSNRPNAAMLGLLLNSPFLVIAVLALLLADRPMPETLPVGFGLQLFLISALFLTGLARAQDLGLVLPAQSGPVHEPAKAPGTWQSYAGSGPAGDARAIALIAPNAAKGRRIAARLAGQGRDVHHCSDSDAMFEAVQARPDDWGLVILDLDTAPDPETAMCDLTDFRTSCRPGVPVVLLSGSSLHSEPCARHRTAPLQDPVLPRQVVDDLRAAGLQFSAAP